MIANIAIFWPMLAQVLLVYIVYVRLSLSRVDAVKSGKATISQFRENRNEPEQSLFARNNLESQFELPVLFYGCVLALFVTGGASLYTIVLAWVFVISRYAHAYIHIKTNRIRYRRPLFVVGYLVLALMWLAFVINLVTVQFGHL